MDSMSEKKSLECTTVWLSNGQVVVVGRNLDHPDKRPLPGRVLVNQRGVDKIAFPIDLDGPEPLRWRSRFGSVTFTFLGKDLSDCGMNEAGLVIEEMSLGQCTQHTTGGQVSRLLQSQWIQYQLDRASSVDEVLGSLDRIEPMGTWHLLVADRTGRRATIEYLGGETQVHTPPRNMVRALTNSTYEEGMIALAKHRADKEGPIDLETASSKEDEALGEERGRYLDSTVRFIHAWQMSEAADRMSSDALVSHALRTLGDLAHAVWTKRSIVWDTEHMAVHYRSEVSPQVRFLRLSELDFSPQAKTLSVDINLAAAGNMLSSLKIHTFEDDEPIVDYLTALIAGGANGQVPITRQQFASSASSETTKSYFARLREYLESASYGISMDTPGA